MIPSLNHSRRTPRQNPKWVIICNTNSGTKTCKPTLHKGRLVIPRCLALVTDLVFGSKIDQTARQSGVDIRIVHDPQKLDQITKTDSFDLAIVDLDVPDLAVGRAVDAIRSTQPKLPIIAFMPHTRTDLADAARRSGVERVLARSAFVTQLPAIMNQLAADQNQTK